MTFQIAPFVFDYLKRGEKQDIQSICLVVVPLLSLMRDQVAALKQKDISALTLDAETNQQEIAAARQGKYNLLFATPESMLRRHRNILRGTLKERIDVVFVDESHCVAKW